MSHTPGPWEFDPIDRVVVKGGSEIAYMARSANGADVRLIAAAPELLTALETLERLAGLPSMQDDPARVKARAAIAKARGQE